MRSVHHALHMIRRYLIKRVADLEHIPAWVRGVQFFRGADVFDAFVKSGENHCEVRRDFMKCEKTSKIRKTLRKRA